MKTKTKQIESHIKKFITNIHYVKENRQAEASTREHIMDFFSHALNYNKMNEIIIEYETSGHFVDIVFRVCSKNKDEKDDQCMVFIVEVKHAWMTLKPSQAFQARNYAIDLGVPFYMLTNGFEYRVYFWNKDKIDGQLIMSFRIDDNIHEVAEKLYLLSRDSFKRGLINRYLEAQVPLQKERLIKAIFSKRVLSAMKRELKSTTGKKINDDLLEKNLSNLFNNENKITSKSTGGKQKEGNADKVSDVKGSWRKRELLSYLNNSTPYQKLLLTALAQQNEKPIKNEVLQELMSEKAKAYPSLGINKTVSGLDIAGARAGLGMRRKPFNKEDIIVSYWSKEDKSKVYELKNKYRQIINDWLETLSL